MAGMEAGRKSRTAVQNKGQGFSVSNNNFNLASNAAEAEKTRQSMQERARLAREKFQALLLAANKVGVTSHTKPPHLAASPGQDQMTLVPAKSLTPMRSQSQNQNQTPDNMKGVRAFVEKAIREHKVFSVVGAYPAVKNALKKRGWVEKTGPLNMTRRPSEPRTDTIPEEETDAQWVARTLREVPPDFIWVIRRDNIDWKGMHRDQIINRFPRAWFTTKVGLSACLQQLHWYSEPNVTETFFPRCYRLCLDDERVAFQEDYRLTACMAFLRYFVEAVEARGAITLVDPGSRITPLSIDFASRQLGNYIRMRRHEDIDWLLPPNFMSQHWEAFLHQYQLVVHEKRRIRFENEAEVTAKYDMAKRTLARVPQYWPQYLLDGVYNMWICKPGARSRGSGIVILNSLDRILNILNQANAKEANWVVQKYMERPMLIYKTKFDLRQWFVITDWSPLTLWFYKESYIRFCTKPFVLEDFHESIHLCNNAIQCRYQNAQERDTQLPDENMWDSYTFQAYLRKIGRPDLWAKIYSGMKQAIIGVLLASQESVEAKKGCFELYGADFMMSEDGTPWLIEINSCPCMAATTSITAKMCVQCLEDTIKIVIDRRINRNADTGMFEMVYRQPLSAVTVQHLTSHDIVVQGRRLAREPDRPLSVVGGMASMSMAQSSVFSTVKSRPQQRGPGSPFYVSTTTLQPTAKGLYFNPPQDEVLTFSDLLARLRQKNTQLFQGYMQSNQAHTLEAAVKDPVDPVDRSMTSSLLHKMRALNRIQEERNREKEFELDQKELLQRKSLAAAGVKTNSTLNKYLEETRKKFGIKGFLGKVEEGRELGVVGTSLSFGYGPPGMAYPKRPGTSPIVKGQGYVGTTERAETAKTLEEVKAVLNARGGNSNGSSRASIRPKVSKQRSNSISPSRNVVRHVV